MDKTSISRNNQIITSHELARTIVENAPNAIITIDARGVIQSFNPKAEQMFGYRAEQVLGKNINMLMPEPYRSMHDRYLRRYQKTGIGRIIGCSGCELTGLKQGNVPFPLELTLAEMQIANETYFLGFVHDITVRKQQDHQLKFMATHDQVTGLINHTQLVSDLDGMIIEKEPFILFYLGLDRFQPINEVLGHGVGDQVLVQVGRRLVAACEGKAQAAHISGSAFVLLWPNPDGVIQALATAQRLYDCLVEPLKLDEFSVDTEASIGIVCYPEHGFNAEDLLRMAEVAMQAARQRQIMFAMYDHEMEQYRLDHLTMASELRRAIESDDLVIYYQPKVDIASRRIVAVEALIRWQHPEKGMIQPDLFIPMAEETGIIHPFTAWLIHKAAGQIRQWQDMGIDLTVAINLAPRNLLEADLPDRLDAAIRHWRIKPARLMVEITERGLIAEPQRALATLARIHKLGMPISIDDFGTGYSSLAYLKDLPVDELKIDQLFIRTMSDDPASLTIVQMVIQMAHYLGLEVTAEGVETLDEWRRLDMLGCERAQGYYMGKPMPHEALERWLQDSPWHPANRPT